MTCSALPCYVIYAYWQIVDVLLQALYIGFKKRCPSSFYILKELYN